MVDGRLDFRGQHDQRAVHHRGKPLMLLSERGAQAHARVLPLHARVMEGEDVLGDREEVRHRLGDVEIGVHLPAVDHLPELVVPPLVVEPDRQDRHQGAHEADRGGHDRSNG